MKIGLPIAGRPFLNIQRLLEILKASRSKEVVKIAV